MIKLVLQALFDLTGKLLNSMFWKNDSKGLEDPFYGQFHSLAGDMYVRENSDNCLLYECFQCCANSKEELSPLSPEKGEF